MFVGMPCQLQSVVGLLCEELELNFLEAGRPCPPWRSGHATMCRWLGQRLVDVVVPPPGAPAAVTEQYVSMCSALNAEPSSISSSSFCMLKGAAGVAAGEGWGMMGGDGALAAAVSGQPVGGRGAEAHASKPRQSFKGFEVVSEIGSGSDSEASAAAFPGGAGYSLGNMQEYVRSAGGGSCREGGDGGEQGGWATSARGGELVTAGWGQGRMADSLQQQQQQQQAVGEKAAAGERSDTQQQPQQQLQLQQHQQQLQQPQQQFQQQHGGYGTVGAGESPVRDSEDEGSSGEGEQHEEIVYTVGSAGDDDVSTEISDDGYGDYSLSISSSAAVGAMGQAQLHAACWTGQSQYARAAMGAVPASRGGGSAAGAGSYDSAAASTSTGGSKRRSLLTLGLQQEHWKKGAAAAGAAVVAALGLPLECEHGRQ